MDWKTGIWAWSCSGFGLSMSWVMAWPVFFYFCLIKKKEAWGQKCCAAFWRFVQQCVVGLRQTACLKIHCAGADGYWQQSTRWRLGVHYRYVVKERLPFSSGGQDILAGPPSVLHHPGLSFKYNAVKNGSLELRFDYLRFAYEQPGNDPLSFEMLEGLQVGDNLTWSLQGARKLGEYLQLTLGYQGRKSTEGPIIHMGNAQIRAFF